MYPGGSYLGLSLGEFLLKPKEIFSSRWVADHASSLATRVEFRPFVSVASSWMTRLSLGPDKVSRSSDSHTNIYKLPARGINEIPCC